MTFTQAMSAQLAHDHDENIRRIRAQAQMRAAKLNLDGVMFAELAADARSYLDPEPALKHAQALLEAA
jgi:hypothetical protein